MHFHLDILQQPDDTTCGPTCLQAVYRYFGDEQPLEPLIAEIPRLEEGGTLAVLLGCHALARGYKATIFTFNLKVFDPTWFRPLGPDLIERLRAQMKVKHSPKLHVASRGYIRFLKLGGKLLMEDLTEELLRGFLTRSIPILTGLSATYLYGWAREFGPQCQHDDVRGLAAGHFVVLCGYDSQQHQIRVADPYLPNPLGEEHHYNVGLDRLICAILLGVLTYDANLLVIEPREASPTPGD